MASSSAWARARPRSADERRAESLEIARELTEARELPYLERVRRRAVQGVNPPNRWQ
jgi:hypothetical protein